MRAADVEALRSELRQYVRLAVGQLAGVQAWVNGPQVGSDVPPPRLPVSTWGELGPELDRDREER